jgi:hypothetical protein
MDIPCIGGFLVPPHSVVKYGPQGKNHYQLHLTDGSTALVDESVDVAEYMAPVIPAVAGAMVLVISAEPGLGTDDPCYIAVTLSTVIGWRVAGEHYVVPILRDSLSTNQQWILIEPDGRLVLPNQAEFESLDELIAMVKQNRLDLPKLRPGADIKVLVSSRVNQALASPA